MDRLDQLIENKKKVLMEKFKSNKEKAAILMKQKNIIDNKMEELVREATPILAKIAGLEELQKE